MATVTDRRVSAGRLAGLARELDTPGGGFSIHPLTGGSVTSGYAVGIYPEREQQIGGRVYPDDLSGFAVRNADVLAGGNAVLGGWRDAETGVAFLDVSVVLHDRKAALAVAREHDQLAIFDLDTGREIRA